MSTFKRQADGTYLASYLAGYTVQIKKRGAQAWDISVRQNDEPAKGVHFKPCKSLTDAQNRVRSWAQQTKTTLVNCLTQQPFETSISTPWTATPASETYHSA